MVEPCLKTCCCPDSRGELSLPSCTFAPGVYQNVNIEINQFCQVVSITAADHETVNLCDPCNDYTVASSNTVAPIYVTPVARVDSFEITQGESSGTAIVSNDDLVSLYYFETGTLPSGVSIDGGGFIHVENTAPTGTYTIPYTLTDNQDGETSTATITLTILQGEHGEVEAEDDSITVVQGKTSYDNVLTNDSLSDGVTPGKDDVVLTALNAPSGLTLNADGTIGVASTVATGDYTFDYQVCDNNGDCAVASVTVTVTEAAANVNVSDKTFTLAQGETSTSIIAGDTLVDGSTPNSQNAFVTANYTPDGLTYDNANYTVSVDDDAAAGTYSFDYQLCDMDDGDCEAATITVIVP